MDKFRRTPEEKKNLKIRDTKPPKVEYHMDKHDKCVLHAHTVCLSPRSAPVPQSSGLPVEHIDRYKQTERGGNGKRGFGWRGDWT